MGRRTRKILKLREKSRVTVESFCSVEGCDKILKAEGPWMSWYPLTPSIVTSAKKTEGWSIHRRRSIVQGIRSPSMLLCPFHSQIWQDYVTELTLWDKFRRSNFKEWWSQGFRQFGMNILKLAFDVQPPDPPFEE